MQLRQLAGSRAPGAEDLKRELYKKVISYMTVGIDVSSLFSEMVMCSATSDIVLKKMCYLLCGELLMLISYYFMLYFILNLYIYILCMYVCMYVYVCVCATFKFFCIDG
jgi:hypothetical protein